MTGRRVSKRAFMMGIGAAAVSTASGDGWAQAPSSALDEGTSLRRPTQAPILRITGRIQRVNDGDAAIFDRATLEGLGSGSITTNTPWYDGVVRFDGVPMTRLMEAVGATGQTLTAVALNDYSTDIPIADFARFGALLATRRNGAPMRVSDRGLLFIVYPYDSDPELRARLYYSRSAWSVAQIIVR